MLQLRSIFVALFIVIGAGLARAVEIAPPTASAAPTTQGSYYDDSQSRSAYVPPALRDIGIKEHGGSTLPLDLTFFDEAGKAVKLGSYFHHGRPVVLQLSYFKCPMLCTLVSKGMVDSLNDLTLTMGQDFDAIDVSFDPTDTPDDATRKKRSFLEAYNRPSGAESWHFLTGKPDSINALTQAVGFEYKKLENGQFSHPAVLMVLSPEGKISRYLYGVKYDPRTLRLALVQASNGKVGTTLDKIILSCCAFDPSTGKYTTTIMGLTRIVCFFTLFVVLIAFVALRRLGRAVRTKRDEDAQRQGLGNLTTT